MVIQTPKRGPWSTSEDHSLLTLVRDQGATNWVRIASYLNNSRSPKQCRERYHQNLKPTLNHDPITPEEGELIERLVGEMGKRWAEIARRLEGRSDNAVKNWWNGGMNRRRRLVIRREGSVRGGREFDESNHSLSFARPPALPPNRPSIITTAHTRRRIEQPLTSPARSEVSMPDSVGDTPSLVSDSGSHISMSSPNAITNAHRVLPPPLESSQLDAWRTGPATHAHYRYELGPPANRSPTLWAHSEVPKSSQSHPPSQRLRQFADVAAGTAFTFRSDYQSPPELPSQRPLPSFNNLVNGTSQEETRRAPPLATPSSAYLPPRSEAHQPPSASQQYDFIPSPTYQLPQPEAHQHPARPQQSGSIPSPTYPLSESNAHQHPNTYRQSNPASRSMPPSSEPLRSTGSNKRKADDAELSSPVKQKMSVSNILD